MLIPPSCRHASKTEVGGVTRARQVCCHAREPTTYPDKPNATARPRRSKSHLGPHMPTQKRPRGESTCVAPTTPYPTTLPSLSTHIRCDAAEHTTCPPNVSMGQHTKATSTGAERCPPNNSWVVYRCLFRWLEWRLVGPKLSVNPKAFATPATCAWPKALSTPPNVAINMPRMRSEHARCREQCACTLDETAKRVCAAGVPILNARLGTWANRTQELVWPTTSCA